MSSLSPGATFLCFLDIQWFQIFRTLTNCLLNRRYRGYNNLMRNFIASPRSAVLLDIVLSHFYKLLVRSCSSQQPLSVLARAVKLFGELSVHLRVSNSSNISLKTGFYVCHFSANCCGPFSSHRQRFTISTSYNLYGKSARSPALGQTVRSPK